MTVISPLRQHRFVLLSLLLFFGIQSAWSMSMTLTIGPYEEACFLVRDTAGNTPKILSVNYELIGPPRISAEPLLVYVMLNDKVVWHSQPNTPYDRFHMPLEKGEKKRYWVCLQNSSHGPNSVGEEEDHPDEQSRVVGFTFRVHAKQQRKKDGTEEYKEKFYDWIDKAEDISEDLQDFYDHFEYLKRREADHRNIVEGTFESCLDWVVLEAIIVIIIAALQVIFYRYFIEKKQKSYNYY